MSKPVLAIGEILIDLIVSDDSLRGLVDEATTLARLPIPVVDVARLFDTPTFRWIPARAAVEVEYCATLRPADAIPDILEC